MDSLSELELRNFLGDDLFLFVSDGETSTTNFAYGSPSHLESTGKELDELFNNAFVTRHEKTGLMYTKYTYSYYGTYLLYG